MELGQKEKYNEPVNRIIDFRTLSLPQRVGLVKDNETCCSRISVRAYQQCAKGIMLSCFIQ